jgi:hypothetical protein
MFRDTAGRKITPNVTGVNTNFDLIFYRQDPELIATVARSTLVSHPGPEEANVNFDRSSPYIVKTHNSCSGIRVDELQRINKRRGQKKQSKNWTNVVKDINE